MTYKIDTALQQAFMDGAFGLPIAYENRDYNPLPGTPYAALYVIPNQPSVNTLGDGGQDLITGIMQVDLNYPVGSGTGVAKQMATTIRDYFKAGTVFTFSGQDVFIVSSGRGIGGDVDSFYRLSNTIFWQARVTRP